MKLYRISKGLAILLTSLASLTAFCNSYAIETFPTQELRLEIDLSQYEECVYSQHGEDGVIKKIFELIGTESKYYVEFGAADGQWISNTKRLREQEGWQGLLLDSGHDNPSINLHRAFITAENINDLFALYNVPHNLDLLSIDIDFNDFYVWNAINENYRPKLIVIEYSGKHLPHEDKIVIYDPNGSFDGTDYFGASILAFYNLGRKKGYSLVYAEKNGVNLFFLRDDLIEQHNLEFKNRNDVGKLYRPNNAHRHDIKNRPFVSSNEILNP
ncbi:MAG: hypothetical protein KF898_01200 [Parachlamydiales bacterium]|nr:hypothetical protein [Candidatus Acheromyda pituitae]